MKQRQILLGCLLFSIVPPSVAMAATIGFVSGTSWDAYDANPYAGGSLLGQAQFVCLNVGCPSSCPPGATLYGYSCGFWGANLTAVPGAHWIWKPAMVSDAADLSIACFSKTLVVTGLVTSATIYIGADDYAEVRVNGQLVGTVGSVTNYGQAAGAQAALVAHDIAPYLVSGANHIVVCAQNGPSSFSGLGCNPCNYQQNPAGVVFGGTIVLDETTRTQKPSWGSIKATYR